MMRRLGQRLAANLAINYFDEPNISPHHVILHEKDDGDWVNDEHETANLTGPPLFRQNTFNFESSFGIR